MKIPGHGVFAGVLLILLSAGGAEAASYGSQPGEPHVLTQPSQPVVAPPAKHIVPPHPVARPATVRNAPAHRQVTRAVAAHHERPVIVRHVTERPVIVRRVIERPVIVRRVVEHPVIVRRVVVRRVVKQVVNCPKPVRHTVTRHVAVRHVEARRVIVREARATHERADLVYAQSHYDYYSHSRVSEVVEQREGVHINSQDFQGGVGDQGGAFVDGYGETHFYAGFRGGASSNGPTYNSYDESFQGNGVIRPARSGMAHGAPRPLGPAPR